MNRRHLRVLLNLGLWTIATFVVALLPLYVEVLRVALTKTDFDLARAFKTVTLLYTILAVTASTLPAIVNWVTAYRTLSLSAAVAIVLGLMLLSGMMVVGAAIGVASASEDLVRDIEIPSVYGISMIVILAASITLCAFINVVAARVEW